MSSSSDDDIDYLSLRGNPKKMSSVQPRQADESSKTENSCPLQIYHRRGSRDIQTPSQQIDKQLRRSRELQPIARSPVPYAYSPTMSLHPSSNNQRSASPIHGTGADRSLERVRRRKSSMEGVSEVDAKHLSLTPGLELRAHALKLVSSFQKFKLAYCVSSLFVDPNHAMQPGLWSSLAPTHQPSAHEADVSPTQLAVDCSPSPEKMRSAAAAQPDKSHNLAAWPNFRSSYHGQVAHLCHDFSPAKNVRSSTCALRKLESMAQACSHTIPSSLRRTKTQNLSDVKSVVCAQPDA